MRPAFVWLFIAFLPLASAIWISQRYDYPKETSIEVVRFGLERGGRYEIDVSFRQKISVPSSVQSPLSVCIIH